MVRVITATYRSKATWLACAIVSVLLVGCGSFREKQESAHKVLNQATNHLIVGIEKAKEMKNALSGSLLEATTKIKATATDLKDRADSLQNSIEKVADAVEQGQEGIEGVKGALDMIDGGGEESAEEGIE